MPFLYGHPNLSFKKYCISVHCLSVIKYQKPGKVKLTFKQGTFFSFSSMFLENYPWLNNIFVLIIGIYFILAVFLLAPSVHLLGKYFTKHFDDNLKHLNCAWCGKMAEYGNSYFSFFS